VKPSDQEARKVQRQRGKDKAGGEGRERS
jgi:hypothetical protein